jgi:SMC interacting uncharacterized protein involved in chromosome segregation
MEPQFDTAMIEWYSMYEAYHQHRLMEQEREPQELTNIETLLRKVAALQECLAMQHDIIAKKDSMQSALQKELDDCYNDYDNSKQQLTEAKREIRTVERFRLEDAASALDEQNRIHKLLTEVNAEKENLMVELKKVSFENNKSLDTLQSIINEKNAEIDRLKGNNDQCNHPFDSVFQTETECYCTICKKDLT